MTNWWVAALSLTQKRLEPKNHRIERRCQGDMWIIKGNKMDFYVKRQWIIDVLMILSQSGYLIIYIFFSTISLKMQLGLGGKYAQMPNFQVISQWILSTQPEQSWEYVGFIQQSWGHALYSAIVEIY